MSGQRLVATLADAYADALRAQIGDARRVALIDFPNHTNVGDSAIWLGERITLHRLGIDVAYACDATTFSPRSLADQLGRDDPILIHGGGNFGDIWPVHQRLRETVLEQFPGRRVVQLPQTIHFRDPATLEATGAAFRAHKDFALMCRDEESHAIARERLGVKTALAPDAAFALGETGRHAEPAGDVLWLGRTDTEPTRPFDAPDGSWWVDWVDETPGQGGITRAYTTLRTLSFTVGTRAVKRRRSAAATARVWPALYDWLARQRVDFGLELLSGGRAVVTDRLHGHILCLLAGIPHVLVDTGYGKLRTFHLAWTSSSDLVRLADSGLEAAVTAQQLTSQSHPFR